MKGCSKHGPVDYPLYIGGEIFCGKCVANVLRPHAALDGVKSRERWFGANLRDAYRAIRGLWSRR